MKRFMQSLILLMAVVFFAACSSVKVSSDYDRMAEFSKYKSFSFFQLTDKGPGLSELNRDRIVNAIKAEMIKKGFTENNSNPDLLVNATAILKTEKQVTANTYGYGGYYRPYYYRAGYGGTTTINVSEYKDGSLVIDLIDAASKKLIWEGTGNKEIDVPLKDAEKIIPAAVAKILAKYPPGQ